jgi:hypothetical protein
MIIGVLGVREVTGKFGGMWENPKTHTRKRRVGHPVVAGYAARPFVGSGPPPFPCQDKQEVMQPCFDGESHILG